MQFRLLRRNSEVDAFFGCRKLPNSTRQSRKAWSTKPELHSPQTTRTLNDFNRKLVPETIKTAMFRILGESLFIRPRNI